MTYSFILEVIVVGLILSADSFSAALAMGFRPFNRKDALKFALSSGLAEALVALAGAFFGSKIISQFGNIDHWVAFILLMGVAIHMAYEGIMHLIHENKEELTLEFHSFTKIIVVSFATSLDALGVGVGLGISGKPLWPFIISIGLWAFSTTIIGLNLAKKLSHKFGPIVNLIGALVLGAMAFQMLSI